MISSAQEEGRHVLLSGAHSQVMQTIDRLGVFALMREGYVFTRRVTAIMFAAELLGIEETSKEAPKGIEAGPDV